jgi:hypothetical protein
MALMNSMASKKGRPREREKKSGPLSKYFWEDDPEGKNLHESGSRLHPKNRKSIDHNDRSANVAKQTDRGTYQARWGGFRYAVVP